jgi:predicted AAA+ superfamily ATPase
VADTTVRGYLDRLTAALVERQLPPWFENVGKRQIKAPTIATATSWARARTVQADRLKKL